MSLIGLAPSYTLLVILLLITGISTAFWHVPMPVMTARVSGRQVGLGMSFFMLGGELARSVGPVIAIGAVTLWGMEGAWRLIPVGMAASAVLYWRLRDVGIQTASRSNGSWAESWREIKRVYCPSRDPLGERIHDRRTDDLFATFLLAEGADLWLAGGALSMLQLAGAVGVLASGTVSDWLGRRYVWSLSADRAGIDAGVLMIRVGPRSPAPGPGPDGAFDDPVLMRWCKSTAAITPQRPTAFTWR